MIQQAFTIDNPPKLYSNVIFRGRRCEVTSAPKQDNTIRVSGFVYDGYAPLAEIYHLPTECSCQEPQETWFDRVLAEDHAMHDRCTKCGGVTDILT